ncbi:ArsR/SmtB family transcription factor [Pseudohoeflea coraliihabitans]|uniref:ArsR family transcriptional regulator n=1 Tax=Pseudohoeflea coraliihabitans TaxID=2860393 RepID=A0ABS6WJE2_9HYPH|nr:helix-turn-helix transcriptional regulator [Pseudohoeflea sp. DP4N28-3]MBW3096067.1 ArsR family transcriptional regulator [Pseudohoeflea sp. DP4N28-3]
MKYHPPEDEIELPTVMATLGDPTRLAILGLLATCRTQSLTCGDFVHLSSKSNLTYHLGRMREAGIIRIEPIGTSKRVTIRRSALDRRFPGFLDAVLRAAGDPAGRPGARRMVGAANHSNAARH